MTSCKLTRVRPNDADTAALAAFAGAEKAKRRLVVELIDLKLPIVSRDDDPQYGLAFDLLSSQLDRVVTGHHNGVITLNLAEGDDVHRERLGSRWTSPTAPCWALTARDRAPLLLPPARQVAALPAAVP